MLSHAPLWTLDELTANVARALALDYEGQVNGRVRDVPDRRTIRYYTTLGLIDRPAQMRGRTALYEMRHLLQLVAIKRLQAQGLALAEIQARLLGLTDRALRGLANLPAGWESAQPAVEPEEPATTEPDRRQEAFWGEPPAPAVTAAEAEAAPPLRRLTGVPLAEGVTLLIEANRSLDDHDLAAVHAAAAPLLQLLRARSVLGGSEPSTKGEAS